MKLAIKTRHFQMSGMQTVVRLITIYCLTIECKCSFKLFFDVFIVCPLRCGSVIVDLALKFSSTVKESDALTTLRDAAKDGTLGDFNVNASAIVGTRPQTATTASTRPTSSPESESSLYILLLFWEDGGFLRPFSSSSYYQPENNSACVHGIYSVMVSKYILILSSLINVSLVFLITMDLNNFTRNRIYKR